jgi:two-component system OmpR family sensor kinase
MGLRLHIRLTLVIGALLVALTIVLGAAIAQIAQHYQAEVSQRLNAGVAMYVTRELSLLNERGVNAPALQELARRVMTVNPSAEVYLLAEDGRILETLQPREGLARRAVDLGPIRRFLASPDDRPVYGDDPGDARRQRVFSAAPIMLDARPIGYLYVVFASGRAASVAAAVRNSYSLQIGLVLAVMIVLVTFIVAAILFGRLTLPLRRLESELSAWDRKTSGESRDETRAPADADEIALLQGRFRSMAARIESQLQQLKAQDTQRRDLVASVSHDLRTPLAALRGYLETVLLKEASLPDATRRHYLEVAQRHAQQLERLIAALFELSKLESGVVTPAFEAFALSELLQDIALRFRLRAQQLGVDLVTSVDPRAPLAYGDVALIERMLENLLDNSLQHTPAGGRIELSLAPEDAGLRVAVDDTGLGIEPEDLPHVFNRFYTGTGRQHAGNGLGLAIVRRIAELHGASLVLKSTPRIGTRVEITLPVAASARVQTARATQSTALRTP